MQRLFVALKIPKEIREKIITFRNEVNPDYAKYKWEPVDKIHLTLKFIGEVRNELVEDIAREIKFIEEYETFNCKLTQFGFFFKHKKPKILWIGLILNNYIDDLVERLNEELEKFSVKSEKRKFNAHLTLRRMSGDEDNDFVKSFEQFKVPEIEFRAGEVVLMKSDLHPSGSTYTKIKSYNLK